jgi:hypothetical protein
MSREILVGIRGFEPRHCGAIRHSLYFTQVPTQEAICYLTFLYTFYSR